MISYKDLFDFDGLDQAFQSLLQSEKQYSAAMSKDINKLTSDATALKDVLLTIKDALSGINITTPAGRGALSTLAVEADAAMDAYKNLNRLIELNKQYLSDNRKEISSLKKEVESLRRQVDAIKTAESELNKELTQSRIKNSELSAALKEKRLQIMATNEATKLAKKYVEAASGSYDEANAKLRQMAKEIKAEKDAMNGLTPELLAKIQEYNKLNQSLKDFDVLMGNHQRNVGNYKSGWNGLSNSINQITREMPAFANSIQTGFMALSNNIPILVDEIAAVSKNVKAMREEGQKVPSVFSQVMKSFFSWQTLLSVSVTLLTIYGKDLIEWIGTLFKGKEAIDRLKLAQKELNEVRREGFKQGQSEIVQLENLYRNARNVNVPLAERKKIVDQLQEQWPTTFKNLSDEDIMAGRVGKAYKELTKQILATAFAKAASDKISENNLREFDNEEKRIKARIDFAKEEQTILKLRQQAQNVTGSPGTGGSNSVGYYDMIAKAEERRAVAAKIIREANVDSEMLNERNARYTKMIDDNVARYGAAVLDVNENEKDSNKEKKNAIELLEEQIQKIKTSIELQALAAKNKGEAFTPSDKDLAQLDVLIEKLNYAKGIIDEARRNRNDLAPAVGSNVRIDTTQNLKINTSMAQPFDLSKVSDVELKEMLNQAIFNKQRELTKKLREEWKRRIKDTQEAIEAEKNVMLEGINFLEQNFMLLSDVVGSHWNQTFAGITNGLKDMVKEGEISLQSFAQIATGLSNGITGTMIENSKARVDQLEKDKDREIGAAGDNAAAKLTIENEYNRKIAAEKRKQAQLEKQNAIFSIAINTAAGIAKTLGVMGPFGIPMTFVIAGMGLAQAAIVAAKPIPAYKRGIKSSPEGLAEIAEEGPEALIYPGGKMEIAHKRQVKWLPKGTEVKTAAETKGLPLRLIKHYEDTHSVHAGAAAIERNLAKMIEFNSLMNTGQKIDYDKLGKLFDDAVTKIPFDQHYFDDQGYSRYRNSVNMRVHDLNAKNSRRGE